MPIRHPVVRAVTVVTFFTLLVAACARQSSPSPSDARESRLREALETSRASYQEALAFGEQLARVRAQLVAKSVFTAPKNGAFLGPTVLLDTRGVDFEQHIADLRIDRKYLREDKISQPVAPSGEGEEVDDALRFVEVSRQRGEVTNDDLGCIKSYLHNNESPLAAENSGVGVIHLRPPRAFGRFALFGASADMVRDAWGKVKSVIVLKPVRFDRAQYVESLGVATSWVGGDRKELVFVEQLECFVFSWPAGELLAAYRTDRIGAPVKIPVQAGTTDPYKVVAEWLSARDTNADFSVIPTLYLRSFSPRNVIDGIIRPAVGRSGSFTVDLAETVEAGKVSCSITHDGGHYRKFVVKAFGEEKTLTDAQLAQLAGYPLESLATEVGEEPDRRVGPFEGRIRPHVRFRLEMTRTGWASPDPPRIQIDCRPGQKLTVTDCWSGY